MEKAIADTNLAAVLPLGRQHSLLNIINIVLDKLGHLIHMYLPKVLQILLCVNASLSTILEKRDQARKILYLVFFCLFLYSRRLKTGIFAPISCGQGVLTP